MKTVVAIHTAAPMVEPIKALFKENMPEVRLINIVDDSLIQDVIKAGQVTAAVKRRLVGYYFAAVDAGADIILNTCSSVGEIAEAAKDLMGIPIVRVDEAMVTRAVEISDSIGVLATLPTTLGPTVRFVNTKAIAKGKKVKVCEGLAKGAFEALLSGDSKRHDELILQTAMQVAREADVLVLAQGSMARMEKDLAAASGKTVLSSPLSGVLAVKDMIVRMR